MEKTDKVSSYTPELDIPNRESGFGGAGASTYTIFNGLNIQGGKPALPPNVDDQGLVFFTRPAMNLSYDNVINIRTLAALADQSHNSAGNALRCLMSPPRYLNSAIGGKAPKPTYANGQLVGEGRSIFVDDENPFITVLSNTLKDLSGWPDWAMDTYTSPEGYQKEQVSWADDFPSIYNTFDLTANFYNTEGSVILDLMRVWLDYMTRVATGEMGPWPEYVVANRIDYQTKIYRFTLDRNRRFVQKVGCTIAFPTGIPNGAVFNYTDETPHNQDQNIVSIPLRCIGAEYDDPIIIEEFNATVGRFNSKMRAANLAEYRKAFTDINLNTGATLINNASRIAQPMVRLSEGEKQLYNYKAYPHISADNEMEWWVSRETYISIQRLLGENRVDEPYFIAGGDEGLDDFSNFNGGVVA